MSEQENWVSLPQAVAIVKAAAGIPQGPAQRTLIAICESGDVRSRWTGHYLKTQPAIHRQDWIGADIDWANFRVVKANGAGMAEVDFSDADLNAWAASQKQPAATSSSPVLGKGEAARRAVTACYPQGVPADVQNGALCRVLEGWIKSELPNMPRISDTMLLRAAGRKK
jgi:hypothetical protein